MFKGIIDLAFPTFAKNLFYGSMHNMGLFCGPDDEQTDGQTKQRHYDDAQMKCSPSMEEESDQNVFS